MQYRTIDPATEERVAVFDILADDALERSLEAAHAGFVDWRERPAAERASLLLAAAAVLEARMGDLARLMTLEMGKPLRQGEAEVTKCAWACRYFAERGENLLADDPRESDGATAFVRYEPLGPVLAIMPWNFPLWQFYRFAAPALQAGNSVLLKHAPNTPQCGLAIAELMRQAGFPEGLVQNVFLSDEQAARVIGDPRVRGVTLTGSAGAGRQVAAVAGERLKLTVLELGGSDPFIVFEDADLERAVRVGIEARCQNSGQSCIAAKRFLVQSSCLARFRERFVDGMRARVVGNPLDPGVEIGPLARADLRDRLAGQIERTIAAGARALCGGAPSEGRGFYYPPTVLVDVPVGSPAANEELFGPAATLASFDTEDEAVALANAAPYGLGSSLWTRDPRRTARLVPRIDAGSVFVNGMVKSDPRLPFGGVKDSGYGRELGREGIRTFVNRKTVWIA